ncbi:hypothetical protein TNCV_4511851 [Trichonephila clavipes]|nr:hypothetical protein TNCV_4511851 [Trichonephila clavipes]
MKVICLPEEFQFGCDERRLIEELGYSGLCITSIGQHSNGFMYCLSMNSDLVYTTTPHINGSAEISHLSTLSLNDPSIIRMVSLIGQGYHYAVELIFTDSFPPQ